MDGRLISRYPDYDDELLATAAEVEGFAGSFIRDDTLVVLVARGKGSPTAARTRIAGFARRHSLEHLVDHGRIATVEVDFTFQELFTVRDIVRAAQLPFTFLDIDESRNRVVIGVPDTASAEPRIPRSIPQALRGAIQLVRATPATLAQATNLRQRQRPLLQALEIDFSVGACTLGFIGYQGTSRFALTAHHCSQNLGVADTTGTVFQPQGGERIGREVNDPPFYEPGTPLHCPYNVKCRYSDASLIALDDSVASGAYLVSVFLPTINIRPGRIHWYTPNVVDMGLLPQGFRVGKVGRTSGYTYDVIQQTCVDLLIGGVIYRCSFRSRQFGDVGDSGASVFYWSDANQTVFTQVGIFFAVEPGSPNRRDGWWSPNYGLSQDGLFLTPFVGY
jgi:hypothetical protein